MVVATPSGVTLAPEGGAHQSSTTPGIGIAQPGLAAFEPAYADELAAIMHWGFGYMQAEDGGAVYLRLSTRTLEQPERDLDVPAAIAGGYWLEPPADGTELAIVAMGAVLPEALDALAAVREDIPGAGLLAITSVDRLHADWLERGDESRAARLLAPVSRSGGLVTVLDGHPSALGWLGSICGHRVEALGTTSFGQSGDIPDLYRAHSLDTNAILEASARLFAALLSLPAFRYKSPPLAAGVAELVDAPDLGSGGLRPWGFESLRPHQGLPGRSPSTVTS